MSSKVALVLLILLVVLFVIVLGWGARKNSSQAAPNDPNSREQFAESYDPPNWASGIGQLMAPFTPKLTLDKNTFAFGLLPVTVSLPSSTDKFRRATFRVVQGCRTISQAGGGVTQDCSAAQINYRSQGSEGHDLRLDSQNWKAKHNDPTRGSLMILKSGGTLTFQCTGMPSCTAVLE